MSDSRYNTSRRDCFKETVCVNASRVYDACRDRECLEDMRVYFTDRDQELIDNAMGIKLKSAEVCNVIIDTEPVPFNRGYYCVELAIYFAVRLEVTLSPVTAPCEVCGVSVYNKKAILFGSEGCVRIFSSDFVCGEDDNQHQPAGNLPKVTCQIAEPICLGAKLETVCDVCCPCIPKAVTKHFAGSFDHPCGERVATVTLGIFMIIQLERQVQMLLPVYDFCMPEKICMDDSQDDPCELFGRISFPTDAFFPPNACELAPGVDCGCGKKSCVDKHC